MGTRGERGRASGRGKPPQLRSLTPRTLPVRPEPTPQGRRHWCRLTEKYCTRIAQHPFRTSLSLFPSLSRPRNLSFSVPSRTHILPSARAFLPFPLSPSPASRPFYPRHLTSPRAYILSPSLSLRLSTGTPRAFEIFHGND